MVSVSESGGRVERPPPCYLTQADSRAPADGQAHLKASLGGESAEDDVVERGVEARGEAGFDIGQGYRLEEGGSIGSSDANNCPVLTALAGTGGGDSDAQLFTTLHTVGFKGAEGAIPTNPSTQHQAQFWFDQHVAGVAGHNRFQLEVRGVGRSSQTEGEQEDGAELFKFVIHIYDFYLVCCWFDPARLRKGEISAVSVVERVNSDLFPVRFEFFRNVPKKESSRAAVWPVLREWNESEEQAYSDWWFRKLASRAWPSLGRMLRSREFNSLYTPEDEKLSSGRIAPISPT